MNKPLPKNREGLFSLEREWIDGQIRFCAVGCTVEDTVIIVNIRIDRPFSGQIQFCYHQIIGVSACDHKVPFATGGIDGVNDDFGIIGNIRIDDDIEGLQYIYIAGIQADGIA